MGGGGTPGGISNASQLGGRTCREMEDGMRDLKKENFNLKLRIYFLEERLGAASSSFKAGSREELHEQNSSLKVRMRELVCGVAAAAVEAKDPIMVIGGA